MPKGYPTDMNRCALCDCQVRETRHVGMYLVGTRSAIGYALCKTCGKQATHGLTPEQLHKLDSNLESEALRLGITSTHKGD